MMSASTWKTRLVWVVVPVALVLAGIGVIAYSHRAESRLFDPSLAARADAICKDAQGALAKLPALPSNPTFEDRAHAVEIRIPTYETMVRRLRRLAEPGASPAYDEWIGYWNEFLPIGPVFADALRTGDPSVYEPAGNLGDEPAIGYNTIARTNGMMDCIF